MPVDMGLVECVGARLHPWLPMESALQCPASLRNGRGASRISHFGALARRVCPPKGALVGLEPCNRLAPVKSMLPSKIQLSPGAGRAPCVLVPVHLAMSRLSLRHRASQQPYVKARSQHC